VSRQTDHFPRYAGSARAGPMLDVSRQSSRESLPRWYTDGLRPKLARAVRDGRVDHDRAAELHQLMTELFEVATAPR
jgi:hypothetical protein